MDLNLETGYRYTIASAFHAEEQIAVYLRNLFNESDTDLDVLQINVQVKDEGTITTDRTSLETIVSMVYIAEEPKMVANLLVQRVDTDAMAKQLQIPSLSATYDNLLPTMSLETVADPDDGRPRADKGLIAITVFLALALLLVASVVLYISGGWDACTHCCINCLFEEIEEEDDYALAKQSTFQVQSYDEGDKNSNDDKSEVNSEAESQAPSVMTEETNNNNVRNGLLGAIHHPNPAAGLGIKTPNRGDTSGYDSEINNTPLSEITQDNGGPLGITSMRKLPKTAQSDDDDGDDVDIEGGLAHLILKRRFKESSHKPQGK